MGNQEPRFDIETLEYEQARHVFDMCRWINEKLAEMEKEDGFTTIYFERKGKNVKKFLEEAYPVAALGLHFFRPADDVFVQCLTGNPSYDAILTVKGFHNFSIKVEVTTTETDDSTKRRQSVSRHGFRWSSGPIWRVGREILSEPEMVDVDAEAEQLVNLAYSRALDKLKKGTYGSDTAILVYIDTHRTLDFYFRKELIEKTEDHIREQQPEIYGIYYCHGTEFLVDGVARHDVW
ncbi:MAG TPA: hypothetical protein VF952_14670 [Chloroflexia bacterium]|jgi:hypothetical protein